MTLTPTPFRRLRACAASGLLALVCLSGYSLHAQNTPKDDARRRGGGTDEKDRRSMNPQDMQARLLSVLRDRLEVPNDEEWAVISERILKVMEVRRASGDGGSFFGGFRGAPGGGGGPGGSTRTDGGNRTARGPGGTSGNPDAQALQAAVTDKMPEAEIKLRLQRLREARLSNELKLSKAQDDLRAVLTVRQEALLVLMGQLR